MAELGTTPVGAFGQVGALDRARGFTAVHAVHITDADRRLLADHSVCACPTTEADLGDGIVGAAALRRAGTNLALGSDANAVIDLVQEARLLEMGDRLGSGERLRLVDEHGEVGLALLDAATRGGATSLGVADRCGTLAVGRPFDAVHFGGFDGDLPRGRWHYAYLPQVDEWRAEARLRLMIRHAIRVG